MPYCSSWELDAALHPRHAWLASYVAPLPFLSSFAAEPHNAHVRDTWRNEAHSTHILITTGNVAHLPFLSSFAAAPQNAHVRKETFQ